MVDFDPNVELLKIVNNAHKSMQMHGGIRFLPIFGKSGSGKTSAARELGTHLPTCQVVELGRDSIQPYDNLTKTLGAHLFKMVPMNKSFFIGVVDQFEEAVAENASLPARFVENLSLLDRGEMRKYPMLFLWLTTNREFAASLSEATSRNRRILVDPDFELHGPPQGEWRQIIEETFSFHNSGKSLADFEVLPDDIERACLESNTVGTAVEHVGDLLLGHLDNLPDMSDHQVIMLWPVTDGVRISRVQQFTDTRAGYVLEWNEWFRELSKDDQQQLPLREYNRARMYFDMRLVPIAAADLQPLCQRPQEPNFVPHKTYTDRFGETHLYNIVTGDWNPETFSPLKERESKRADEALGWYRGANSNPTFLGQRIALTLRQLGCQAEHEVTMTSQYGTIRPDVLVTSAVRPTKRCIELKAFSPENTMPSSIRDAVRSTLRKYAQFAGFLARQ